MIVCHEHKFIFLRTEKTGGTSIQAALSQFCGPDDMVTGIGGPKHQWRPEWTRLLPYGKGPLRRRFPRYFGLHSHAAARQVRDFFGRGVFNSYFKFSIERNPWDRQVSLYFQRRGGSGDFHVSDFDKDMRSRLYRSLHYTRIKNWKVYSIDDKVVADKVMKYDQLADEFPYVLKSLGLPSEIDLPAMRSGFRPSGRPYREFYTEATQRLIGDWYSREIEAFGFEF